MAGLLATTRITKKKLSQNKIVFLGAGGVSLQSQQSRQSFSQAEENHKEEVQYNERGFMEHWPTGFLSEDVY